MTNYEHHRNDIEKYARLGIEIAVEKASNRLVPCNATYFACYECLFHMGSCKNEKLQWADEEYTESK